MIEYAPPANWKISHLHYQKVIIGGAAQKKNMDFSVKNCHHVAHHPSIILKMNPIGKNYENGKDKFNNWVNTEAG